MGRVTEDAPPAVRHFIAMKRRTAVDPAQIDHLGEWVARSASWLTAHHDQLLEAVVELDRQAVEARADLTPAPSHGVSTFFGVVARLDTLHGEVDGGGQTPLVSRYLLEREGLATIGQPVAILEEALPGGVYSSVSSAVAIEQSARVRASPYDAHLPSEGFVAAGLDARARGVASASGDSAVGCSRGAVARRVTSDEIVLRPAGEGDRERRAAFACSTGAWFEDDIEPLRPTPPHRRGAPALPDRGTHRPGADARQRTTAVRRAAGVIGRFGSGPFVLE